MKLMALITICFMIISVSFDFKKMTKKSDLSACFLVLLAMVNIELALLIT